MRMTTKPQLPVKITRKFPPPTLQPFTDYFQGFEKVQAVRKVFGDETSKVLAKLKIGFISMRYMYMGINDDDGNLGVGTYHLAHAPLKTLYLDIVHELFHVKQFMEDKEYFHEQHMRYLKNGFDPSLYYQNAIEIPAYEHTVREAERIGLGYDEIVDYLKIGEVDPEVFAEFLGKMRLKPSQNATKQKLPIRIKRKAQMPLHPFTDFFKGFEETEAIHTLFGNNTNHILDQIKVEITRFPFNVIMPSEDGHLIISEQYLKGGDVKLLYTDIILCMNLLKRISEGHSPFTSDGQEYGDNPDIIESYKTAVREARRIGVTETEILAHVGMARRLMSPPAYKRFLRKLGLKESE
jgi:hypothetical protein